MATVNRTMKITHNTASAENWREGGGGSEGAEEWGEGERKGRKQGGSRAHKSLTFSSMAMFLRRERGSMTRRMVTVLIREVLMTHATGSVSAITTRTTHCGKIVELY